jgi:hypothetical protein
VKPAGPVYRVTQGRKGWSVHRHDGDGAQPVDVGGGAYSKLARARTLANALAGRNGRVIVERPKPATRDLLD